MQRYFRTVSAWLAFGFAYAVAGVVFFSRQLRLDADTDELRILGFKALIAMAVVGFGLGTLSFFGAKTRWHKVAVGYLTKPVNWALLIATLVSLAQMGFELAPEFSQIPLARFLVSYFGTAWDFTGVFAGRYKVPTIVGEVTVVPVILMAFVIAARSMLNWGLRALAPKTSGASVKLKAARRDDAARDVEAEKRAMAASRKVAVASYAEAKALLETTEVQLTFLSLDVAGSTKMKQGEDPYVIEQAFTDYRRLVERVLKRHAAYKQTWTPDGQMAAFRTPQAAVNCGREILSELPDFNKNVSKLRTPFTLRVGANCGVVSTDDQTPMEQISDFTIDVAGHMQKYADIDSIWMSEAVFTELTDPTGIEPNGKEVDTRKVYVWKRPDA